VGAPAASRLLTANRPAQRLAPTYTFGEVNDPGIEPLLDGLAGSARDERAELIEWLLEQGITVEEIRGAITPMLLPSRRLLGDDGRFVSAREIAESGGMDLELLQRVQRAIGLAGFDDPDAVVHMNADGAAATHAQRFIEIGLQPDHVVQVVRILAEGLSRAAEVMRYTALATVLEPNATELETAKRSRVLSSQIAPRLGPMIEAMLFMQLRHSMETEAVNVSERAAGVPLPGARQVAVGFADLVGFTRLGEAVPPEELVQLADRLTDLARDVAVPPVRLIKTIGDAVMFVCPQPAPLLDALLKLVDVTDSDDDFPRLRAGLAAGSAVCRAGDWYGSPVNAASRVTGAARPGAVLVTESVRAAVGDGNGFCWSDAGPRHLKGIKGEVSLYRARRGAG
jgi:adenylate cyclase